jgi:RNA polymerase sigma-70 factor (sigma-E family)
VTAADVPGNRNDDAALARSDHGSRGQCGAAGRVDATEAEFTAFVAGSYGRLLHIADLIIGDRGRAEDLLQTVLVRTFLRWPRISPAGRFGYVRSALMRGRTDWWRRLSSRERPSAVIPETRAVPDPAGQVVDRTTVQRALSRLTRRERAVVVLRFYEDLSEAEIARELRIAPGTVKSTCARALTKLRISPELAEPTTTVLGLSRLAKERS